MRKQCFALLTLLMVVIASLLNGVSAPATAQSATLAMLTPDNAAKIERLAQIDTEYTSGLFSWSPDGSQIAIGTSYQVKLYKTSDPQAAPRIFQYREKPANLSIDWFSITFSPDGTKMLVLGDEYQLWDVAGSTMQPMKDLPRHAHEFFSPDSKWLVTLDGESNPPKVQFWDTSTGKLITDFPSPDNHISAFALSHDQKLLAIVNWEQDHDFTLQLWDVGTRRELTSVTISKEPVTEVNFSPDGKVIAAIGTDGKLYLYRVPDLSEVARIPVSYVEKLFLAFHPARPVLATSDESGSGVTLYDIAKGVKFADLPDSSQPSGVFSPDGRWFSYSTYLEKEQNSPDGCIQIYNLEAKTSQARICPGGPKPRDVYPVAFTPDGKLLLATVHVSGSVSKRSERGPALHLYDVNTGKLVKEIDLNVTEDKPIHSVRMNRAGTAIAVSRGGVFCCGEQHGSLVVEWWGVRQ